MTHCDKKTGIASGRFHNSLQKMESIDGEMDHNNYYRPCEHHSGVLIDVLLTTETRLKMRIRKLLVSDLKILAMDLALLEQPNMVTEKH